MLGMLRSSLNVARTKLAGAQSSSLASLAQRNLSRGMGKMNLSLKSTPKAKPAAPKKQTTSSGRGFFSTTSSSSSKKKVMMIVGGAAGVLTATATGMAALDRPASAEGAKSTLGIVSVYDVPLGKKAPDVIPCFIEVSRGSRNKYEWDNHLGFLTLDRVLHSAVFYPHNYGFIPQTLCGDGDPLDVLVMGDLPLQPGSLVDVRPIAYMIMEDEKGMDEKVLAVVNKDPHYVEMQTLRDVPEHVLREIAHFFGTYKALEKKKWVKVGGWKGTADTKKLIQETHETYKSQRKEGPIEYSGN